MERERLLREAPGLIERMGYYFTRHGRVSFPGRGLPSALLLALYDALAGIKRPSLLATRCRFAETIFLASAAMG